MEYVTSPQVLSVYIQHTVQWSISSCSVLILCDFSMKSVCLKYANEEEGNMLNGCKKKYTVCLPLPISSLTTESPLKSIQYDIVNEFQWRIITKLALFHIH